MQLPDNEEELRDSMLQLHGVLKQKLEAHIDANGHIINEHDSTKHIVSVGERYANLIGETGATYYLRRRYNPEPVPNWAVLNPQIMDAFFQRNSIKSQATILATKCGNEWVHDSIHPGS